MADWMGTSPVHLGIDGFPADPAAPTFEAHLKIDEALRWQEETRGTYATGHPLNPNTDEERAAWREALLERVEWHCLQGGTSSDRWLNDLSGYCNLLMGFPLPARLPDQSLLRLARFGDELHSNGRNGRYFHNLPEALARALEGKPGPLGAELAVELNQLARYLVEIHSHSASTYAICWRLFLDVDHLPVGDCFSNRVSAEWRALTDPRKSALHALFALADHQWQSESHSPRFLQKVQKAVAGCGLDWLSAQFDAWIPNPGDGIASMSGAGMTLLRQMLIWTIAEPKLTVDRALYKLAGVQWDEFAREMLLKEWLGTFLQSLARRDPERAFAVAERLINNPQTAGFLQVRQFYESRLHEVMASAGVGLAAKGIDEYPLAADPELEAEQRILDELLRSSARAIPAPGASRLTPQTAYGTSQLAIEAAVRQAKDRTGPMLRAMRKRALWLAARHTNPAPETPGYGLWLNWRCNFGSFYCALLERPLDLSRDDLLGLLEVDSLAFLAVTPSERLYRLCVEWTDEHGFEPEVTAAIRKWAKSLHGPAAMSTLRKKVEWLLWFDPVGEVDAKHCWSSQIQISLREMDTARSSNWRRLLRNATSGASAAPPQKWRKQALKLYQAVGRGEFRLQLRSWFEPFRDGVPQRITTTGRDLLRSLLWFALVAEDPELDDVVTWFAQAHWKTKADAGKIGVLTPAFVHVVAARLPAGRAATVLERFHQQGQVRLMGKCFAVYEDLCQKIGRATAIEPKQNQRLPDAQKLIEKVLNSQIESIGGSVNVDEVLIHGLLDNYRIRRSDGRITRVSDGKLIRIELDMKSPMLAGLKPMIDGPDIQNPFAPNHFRLVLCAMILANDKFPLYGEIVEDETAE